MSHYEGNPCKKCNATLRYKSNNACVACEKERWRTPKYKQQHKLRQQKDTYKKQRQEYKYRYRYGLTKEEVFRIKSQQNSICPICLLPSKRFCIDHNHETGKVRGLLCYRCNTGLGFFLDDSDVLRRAIEYLEKERATQK